MLAHASCSVKENGSDFAKFLANILFSRLLYQVQGAKGTLLYTQFAHGVPTGTLATRPVYHFDTAVFYLEDRWPRFAFMNYSLRDTGCAGFLADYIANAASCAFFLVYYEVGPF